MINKITPNDCTEVFIESPASCTVNPESIQSNLDNLLYKLKLSKSGYVLRPGQYMYLKYEIDEPSVKFVINNNLFYCGIVSNYIYTDTGFMLKIFNSNTQHSVRISPTTILGIIKSSFRE